MITTERLKGFKEEEYISAILALSSNSLKLRGYRAQKKQIEDIVVYLENHSLTTNIDDSKDKTWDRLKVFLDSLSNYLDKLEDIENKIIALEKEEKKEKKGRSILDLIGNEEES
jgi:transcriptional regulator of heat shock response